MRASLPSSPPQLQPPGAGLPWYERLVGGVMLRRRARGATRRQNAARFAQERDQILDLVRSCCAQAAARPVLIARLRGMEDSSRFWSVCMTLEHLRIVNHGTGELIRLLGLGQTPTRRTGTADVKPRPGIGVEVIGAFEAACAHFARCVDEVAELRTAVRWPHPWFGPLDAADWHFFTAFHMKLHHHQIEAILRSLDQEQPRTGPDHASLVSSP